MKERQKAVFDLIESLSYVSLLIEGKENFFTNNVRDRSIANALIIACIICYCRPFKKSKGLKALSLPNIFSSQQEDLHNRTILVRDRIIAHSDDQYFSTEDLGSNAMSLQRDVIFSAEDVYALQKMIGSMLGFLNDADFNGAF